MNLARKLPKRSDDGYTFRDQRVLEWTPFEAIGIPLSSTITTALRSGRIWALPPERGCVRRTSRSTPECQAVVKRPQCAARADPLRLVLRRQPRSVSQRFSVWVSRFAREHREVHFAFDSRNFL